MRLPNAMHTKNFPSAPLKIFAQYRSLFLLYSSLIQIMWILIDILIFCGHVCKKTEKRVLNEFYITA